MLLAFLDHHLDNWHAKVFLGMLRESGHEVVGFESNPLEDDWCAANGVQRFDSAEAAAEAADAILVLAPDDIESHLALCQAALPTGKPTFVDKLLAPTVAEAEVILGLAERYGTPLTAASSLRHAVELEEALEGAGHIEEGIFSGYGDWNRYGVHTVAMALRVIQSPVAKIDSWTTAHVKNVQLGFEDGRQASLSVVSGKNASAAFPWRFALREGDEYRHGSVARFEEFYRRQMDYTLQAFARGESMNPNEMLDTVRILEAVKT
jgi:hypothetical protein